MKAKVGGLAAKRVAVRADLQDLDRGVAGSGERHAEAEKRLGIGRRPDPGLDRLDEIVRDMPLADDQLVELDHAEAGGQGIEAAAVVRVSLDPRGERGEAPLQLTVGSLGGEFPLSLFSLLVINL